ncbi:hypothetical protein PBCV1_A229L [Paramecium bursaria Chlorella virus 1]|uniref:Uncharacterized protein n=1 Tax=Paramecium bursaria Chlorella virus 1 TaxID=10506 RepID=Q84549_PBCV1|nr:hypothetical protein PBCV1_A229L [Paramecium bursaria Chlorella virus 1]AAC96597.1 hypothetical protein [Paramecium bursaria Chlorella virus 1]
MDINTVAVDFCGRSQVVSSVICTIAGAIALWSSVKTHEKKSYKVFSMVSFAASVLLFGFALTSYVLRDNIAFCSLVI